MDEADEGRSTLIMLAHIPFPFGSGNTTQLLPGLAVKPNFALLVYLGYQVYYFLLEPIGAVSHIILFKVKLIDSSHSYPLVH